MIVDLGLNDNKESNLFLRALWANFTKRYGKCAWQYTPYKYGKKQIIFLGYMDIDLPHTFSVYVHYRKKAVINKLEFLFNYNDFRFLSNTGDKEISSEIKQQFLDIINETNNNFKNPNTESLNITISSYFPISNYYSDLFRIEPYGDGLSSVTLSVKSYGSNDANFIFRLKITRLLDILSVLTNLPYSYSNRLTNSKEIIGDEIFYNDEEFIDGYPIKNENILITKYGKKIIENVLTNDDDIENNNLAKLLNAAMHFHAGRKFDAQINDLYILNDPEKTKEDGVYRIGLSPRDQRLFNAREVNANIQEIATVSYISALEVLSSIVFTSETERCKQCNQLVYSISSKVKDLLFKYFPDYLAKQLHNYYSSRSKFLHEGKLLTGIYTGTSIPQLDYNHPSGCKVINEIPLINLREYTGYCIREVIKEYFI